MNVSTKYLPDSLPVAGCDNIRIPRARILRGAQWGGRRAARRRYFYGVKVQALTTEEGVPVEFAFLPGSASDVRGLEVLPLSLPEGGESFIDSGYTDYASEDAARELDGVTFAVQRRRGLKRWDEPRLALLQATDAQAHRDRFQPTDGGVPEAH